MPQITCPKCLGKGCVLCGNTGMVEKATKEEKKILGRKQPKKKGK